MSYSKKVGTDTLRVLTLDKNRGKGGAIRMVEIQKILKIRFMQINLTVPNYLKGVMKSRGKLILFADADGATRFCDFERLEKQIMSNLTSPEVNSLLNISEQKSI
jgi:dolichyl-phosphate beta-glucosyltransferase